MTFKLLVINLWNRTNKFDYLLQTCNSISTFCDATLLNKLVVFQLEKKNKLCLYKCTVALFEEIKQLNPAEYEPHPNRLQGSLVKYE